MKTEEQHAAALAAWLDGDEDSLLEPDVAEVLGVLRPERLAPPQLDLDAVLADVRVGPLASTVAPAPANRPWRWLVPLAAAAVLVLGLRSLELPVADSAPAVAVATDEPTATAKASAPTPRPPNDAVRRELEARELDIARCFLDASSDDAALSGAITLTWTVIPGQPVDVTTPQNATGSALLNDCMSDLMRHTPWPDDTTGTWTELWSMGPALPRGAEAAPAVDAN